MPRVFIIPGDTPNAFATGRDEHHAVVAVTEGILRILNRDELEGVIAHELTHIKQTRYPHRLHRRDTGRGHRHAGQYGPVGRHVRRGKPR